MTTRAAIRLALSDMRAAARIHDAHVLANLHDCYGLRTPSAVRAARERLRRREAIIALEDMIDKL